MIQYGAPAAQHFQQNQSVAGIQQLDTQPTHIPPRQAYRSDPRWSLNKIATAQAPQQQPALLTLASLAACAPAATGTVRESTKTGASTRSSTPTSSSSSNMNQAHTQPQIQYAPAATAGGGSNGSPTCFNCQTSTTPLWRRDESGSVLCNACGLFLKLHGRPRPISLKTDVIKSRNRVRTSSARKQSGDGQQEHQQHHQHPHLQHSYPAAHPDVAHPGSLLQSAHGHPSPAADGAARTHAPAGVSRSNTPSNLFDPAIISFDSPHISQYPPHRNPSPSISLNGNSNLEPPQSYDALHAQNSHLRTRVSELEVINDLFRGRVGELEQNEAAARRAEQAKDDEVQRMMAELAAANAKAAVLHQRVVELEGSRDSPERKRVRRSATATADDARNGDLQPGSSNTMTP